VALLAGGDEAAARDAATGTASVAVADAVEDARELVPAGV
jgi:hypothetical protein